MDTHNCVLLITCASLAAGNSALVAFSRLLQHPGAEWQRFQPSATRDEEEEYVVEKVLDSRVRGGKKEYIFSSGKAIRTCLFTPESDITTLSYQLC